MSFFLSDCVLNSKGAKKKIPQPLFFFSRHKINFLFKLFVAKETILARNMDEPVTDNGVEVQEDKRTTRRTVKAKRGVNESAKKALEDLNRIKKDGGKRDYEVSI